MTNRLISAVFVGVLTVCRCGLAEQPQHADQFGSVTDYIRDHLIGRTLEAKTVTKITGGSLETEFVRRTMYLNLVRTDSAATFDAITVIKQKLWDLDGNGRRVSEVPRIKDRALATRYGLRRSKATGEVIGGVEGITSSMDRPVPRGDGARLWMENDHLVMVITTAIYTDAFDNGDKYKPMAAVTTTEYSSKDGKVFATTKEKGFDVNAKTLERTPNGHDVTIEDHEIDALF